MKMQPSSSQSTSSGTKRTNGFVAKLEDEKPSIKDLIQRFYFEQFDSLLHGFKRGHLLSLGLLAMLFLQGMSLSYGPAFLARHYFDVSGKSDEAATYQNHQSNTQSIDSTITMVNADISIHFYTYKILLYTQLFPIFDDIFSNADADSLDQFYAIVFLCMNFFLIFIPCVKLAQFIVVSSQKSTREIMMKDLVTVSESTQHASQMNKKGIISTAITFLNPLVSFLFQSYRYVFMIPILLSSAQNLNRSASSSSLIILSYLNLLLCLSISSVIALHDFGIYFVNNLSVQSSYVDQDYLARRLSIQTILQLLGDWIKCGVYAFSGDVTAASVVAFISLGFSLVDYAEFIRSHMFLKRQIAMVNFALMNVVSIANCCIILFMHSSISNGSSFSGVFVFFVPITWMTSLHVFEYLESVVLNQPIAKILKNAQLLNLYARILQGMSQSIDVQEYLFSKRGVEFESVLVRHASNCVDIMCACREINDELLNNGVNKSNLRKKFIDVYLLQMFSEFLGRSKVNQFNMVRFELLALLIDSVKCPMKSTSEAIMLRTQRWDQLSVREKIVLNVLRNRASILFDSVIISAEKQSAVSVQKPTSQQQHTSQVPSLKDNGFYKTDTQLFDIIRFDTLLTKFQKTTRNVYLLQREFYNVIACEEVDLLDVKNKGEHILGMLDQVDQMINELNRINPLSRRSQELTMIYTAVFDMRKQRIRTVVSKQRKSVYHKIISGDERALDLFSSKSCCMMVSLIKPMGIIRRCTKTVFNVFGLGQSEVMNKPISMLMPDEIGNIHDRILDMFVKEGKTTRLMTTTYFLMGKSFRNFIFPIEVTLRLTNLESDFGLTAFIQAIDNGHSYILIDDKMTISGRKNKILNMSEDLYQMCFNGVLNENRGDERLGQIDLYKFIPFMQALDKSGAQELEFFQTLLIFPTIEAHFQNMKKRIKITKKTSSEMALYLVFCFASGCGFLDISFSVKRFTTNVGSSFKYIEIQNMRRVKRRSERIEGLNTLRSDMGQILRVDINVEEDIARTSLMPLNGKIKLQLSSDDITGIFKLAPHGQSGGILNHNMNQFQHPNTVNNSSTRTKNAESQQQMLKKKMTLQSLSNKDTTHAAKSLNSSPFEFEDEEDDEKEEKVEGEPIDLDDNLQTYGVSTTTLGGARAINSNTKQMQQAQLGSISSLNLHGMGMVNAIGLGKSQMIRSMQQNVSESYLGDYAGDASHAHLKKSFDDSSSFQIRLRGGVNGKGSSMQLTQSGVLNKGDHSDMNISHLKYQIDDTDNDIRLNDPIPLSQSISHRDIVDNYYAHRIHAPSYNNQQLQQQQLQQQQQQYTLNNQHVELDESILQKNLKNFDSFQNNHPSQPDSFGDHQMPLGKSAAELSQMQQGYRSGRAKNLDDLLVLESGTKDRSMQSLQQQQQLQQQQLQQQSQLFDLSSRSHLGDPYYGTGVGIGSSTQRDLNGIDQEKILLFKQSARGTQQQQQSSSIPQSNNSNQNNYLLQQQSSRILTGRNNNVIREEEEDANTFRDLSKQVTVEPISSNRQQLQDDNFFGENPAENNFVDSAVAPAAAGGNYGLHAKIQPKITRVSSSHEMDRGGKQTGAQQQQQLQQQQQHYLYAYSKQSTGLVSHSMEMISAKKDSSLLTIGTAQAMVNSQSNLHIPQNSQTDITPSAMTPIIGSSGSGGAIGGELHQEQESTLGGVGGHLVIGTLDSQRQERQIKQQMFFQGTLFSSQTTAKQSTSKQQKQQMKESKIKEKAKAANSFFQGHDSEDEVDSIEEEDGVNGSNERKPPEKSDDFAVKNQKERKTTSKQKSFKSDQKNKDIELIDRIDTGMDRVSQLKHLPPRNHRKMKRQV